MHRVVDFVFKQSCEVWHHQQRSLASCGCIGGQFASQYGYAAMMGQQSGFHVCTWLGRRERVCAIYIYDFDVMVK